MGPRILIVEDEPAVQELLAHVCRASGFTVSRADGVIAARAEIAAVLPHLVILDWMLPDEPGINLLRSLRADDRTRALPVILLTAKRTEAERVEGLDAGADDYVVKPFSPRELVSRMRSLLRARMPQLAEEWRGYGPIRLSVGRREVTVGGTPVRLGLAEFRLLSFLLGNPGRVFTRDELLNNVWGDHVFIEERTVDVHVLRLRKALAPVGADGMLQTVRGRGYKLFRQNVAPDPSAGSIAPASPDEFIGPVRPA